MGGTVEDDAGGRLVADGLVGTPDDLADRHEAHVAHLDRATT